MPRDAVLDQLKIDIETYSVKLKSSFFNDQSKFRKQQAKTLIALIAEAQRDFVDGFSPPDTSGEINEIIDECNRTTKIGSSRLAVLAGKVRDQLAASRALYGVRPRKYKSVQCIGFFADVTPPTDKSLLGEKKSMARTLKYGGVEDDKVDIAQKIDRFMAGIAEAEGTGLINNNKDVLKIFMGPEFFLRGSKGSYSGDSAFGILNDLRSKTKDKKYEDWLFIPGTAIASFCEAGDTSAEVFNIAFIQRGGLSDADGVNEALVLKEYVSAIDFLSANANHHDFNNKLIKGGNNPLFRSAVLNDSLKKINATQGSRDIGGNKSAKKVKEEASDALGGKLAGGSVFTIDGIRFGLEVCLDHAMSRLRNAVCGAEGTRKINPVDVQLIPSAGMTIDKKCIGTKDGGIIFNVDGLRGLQEKAIDLFIAGPAASPGGFMTGKRKGYKKAQNIASSKDSVVIFESVLLPK